MAGKLLYQVVPTKSLPSIMEKGLAPRLGISGGVEYSSRVWLYTDLSMAQFMAWLWFHEVLSDAEERLKRDLVHHWTNGRDIGWRWNGKDWQAVSINTLSVVQIDRTKLHCYPSEIAFGLPPQFRRKLYWTPHHVAPPFTVRKLNKEDFLSGRFQQFMAHIPSVKAAQKQIPVVRENSKIGWLKGPKHRRASHHNLRRIPRN